MRQAGCFHPGVRVLDSKGDLRTYSPLGVRSFNHGTSKALTHSFVEFVLDLLSCFGYGGLLPRSRHNTTFPYPLWLENEVTFSIKMV